MSEIKPGMIFKQIPKIMLEVEAIKKDRNGPQGNYKFRGVDDIYNELQARMAKHGVFTTPKTLKMTREERTSKAGGLNIYSILEIEFTFHAEDGSNVVATMVGEGMDNGDKASNKAQSVAHKYALLQVFMIPTEDPKDPENESHDLAPGKKPGENIQDLVNKMPAATSPANAPKCSLCGKQMKLSKAGLHYFCPDFNKKDKGEHPTVKA